MPLYCAPPLCPSTGTRLALRPPLCPLLCAGAPRLLGQCSCVLDDIAACDQVEYELERNEIIALFNTLAKLLDSVFTIDYMSSLLQVSHGLQLQSLWIAPTAAVS